jgi:hypothetical protein
VFSGNTAFVGGGAVAVAIAGSSGGTLTATDCTFTGNSALTGVGGAVANFAGTGVKTILQDVHLHGLLQGPQIEFNVPIIIPPKITL